MKICDYKWTRKTNYWHVINNIFPRYEVKFFGGRTLRRRIADWCCCIKQVSWLWLYIMPYSWTVLEIWNVHSLVVFCTHYFLESNFKLPIKGKCTHQRSYHIDQRSIWYLQTSGTHFICAKQSINIEAMFNCDILSI